MVGGQMLCERYYRVHLTKFDHMVFDAMVPQNHFVRKSLELIPMPRQFRSSLTAVPVVVVACLSFAQAAQWKVSSPADVTQASESARPGDEIIIADGRYSNWHVHLACRGTVDGPIVVRSETRHQAVFTGVSSFELSGQHIVISELAFEGCRLDRSPIAFSNAKFCRVTECRFGGSKGRAPVVRFQGHAAHNKLDHCTFTNTEGRCVQVKITEDSATDGPPTSNHIERNLFRDVPPKGGNGRETIQIGSNQREFGHIESQTVVEGNVFLRCNGETEIISNKSSSNIYRGNLFKDCRGELTLRGGANCLVEGNRFEACDGGIRVLGTDHRVIQNVIVGVGDTGIRLGFGHTRDQGGLNQAAGNCLVANNTIVDARRAGLWLGSVPSRQGIDDRPVAPYGNRVVNNIISGETGVLLRNDRSPKNVVERNLLHATGDAHVGNPGNATILGDPRFVNQNVGDYRLRKESPASGAALQLLSDGGTANIGASGNASEPWKDLSFK